MDFVDGLLATMLQSNPTCFIGLPRHVRRTMILNGIAAAEGCGFQTRSTYAAFISLQCHASPDFHLHPDIQAIFQLELPEQQCMDAILEDVSEQTWTDIQADANPCAWFEPRRPEQLAIRTAARVCANFPEIVDANQEADIVTFFRAAVFRAAQHGIDWDEGIAAFAAALYLYGPQLDQADGPRWAGAVFLSSKFSSAKIANLLRTRIALDTALMWRIAWANPYSPAPSKNSVPWPPMRCMASSPRSSRADECC